MGGNKSHRALPDSLLAISHDERNHPRDFERTLRHKKSVKIQPRFGEDDPIFAPIGQKHLIREWGSGVFELEASTVWSFPKRGTWATHISTYRGNWAPQIPRNIILRYSAQTDTVLDQMVGSGTTLIECKLLGRNGIGVEVNKEAILLTRDRLNFSPPPERKVPPAIAQKTFLGDARNLNLIADSSVDLIATHPPYANIISYSKRASPHDLSQVHDIDEFAQGMRKAADEAFRVLKPGRFAAVLIGDTRRKQMYIPVAYRVMQEFLNAGFTLKEDIIKRQWNCQATPFWRSQSLKFNFHLIMHEHLFVFRKPG